MLILITGLGLMVLGFLLTFVPGVSSVSTVLIAIGALVFLVGLVFQFFQSVYRKTSADESFVRTGFGGPKVVVDGGIVYLPLFHKLIVVSLKTSKLIVKNEGAEGALRTLDNLKADIEAAFFVRIAANRDNILNAARTLGANAANEQAVEDKIKEKLVSGLRSVAATQKLESLLRDREAFANEVRAHLAPELEHQGLTLESVLIIHIDQSDLSSYDDSNVFDAQGKRAATEIVQRAAVERNKIENEARAAIAQKDVETAKQILSLEQDKSRATAEQQAQVAMIQADQARQRDVYTIEQEQLTKLRQVEADQMVASRQVEKDKQVALLNVEKGQATQVAEVSQQTAVETSRRQQQIAIAQKERERAEAEAARLLAEAERQKAEQGVVTVQVQATAEREKVKKVIDAEAAARQKLIDQQTAADAQAYTRQKAAEAEAIAIVRAAEGRKTAAQAEAEATIKAAEAAQKAKTLAAQGEQSIQMVPVNVAREQVNVNEAQVEVERKQLEYRQANAAAGIELQVRIKQIEAERDVRVAQAQSVGEALSGANMRVITDAESLQNLMAAMMRGMQAGMLAEGLRDATPPEIKAMLGTASAGLISALVKKVTGVDIDESQAQSLVESMVRAPDGAASPADATPAP